MHKITQDNLINVKTITIYVYLHLQMNLGYSIATQNLAIETDIIKYELY